MLSRIKDFFVIIVTCAFIFYCTSIYPFYHYKLNGFALFVIWSLFLSGVILIIYLFGLSLMRYLKISMFICLIAPLFLLILKKPIELYLNPHVFGFANIYSTTILGSDYDIDSGNEYNVVKYDLLKRSISIDNNKKVTIIQNPYSASQISIWVTTDTYDRYHLEFFTIQQVAKALTEKTSLNSILPYLFIDFFYRSFTYLGIFCFFIYLILIRLFPNEVKLKYRGAED